MIADTLVVLLVTICSIRVTTLAVAEELTVDNMEKRAPGWGKRNSETTGMNYLQNVLSDLSHYDDNLDESSDIDVDKRRPGWGKRSFSQDEYESVNKRRPGWGKRSYYYDFEPTESKRAPGWGKRDYYVDDDIMEDGAIDKRRPGWGKRSGDEGYELNKRRPGWGKRSGYDGYEMTKRRPGWGKRAPGWGKRSETTSSCTSLINDIRLLRMKLALVSRTQLSILLYFKTFLVI